MSIQLEARFNRLKLSEKDFSEAHDYLVHLAQASNTIVQQALILAAIIAYSRPFKRSYGSAAQADSSLVLSPSFFEDREDQALHDKIITLRDEGIAHSDYGRRPTRRVPTEGRGFMTWSKPFVPLAEVQDTGRFQRLAWKLKHYCLDQLFAIDRQLKSGDAEGPTRAKGIVLVADGTTEINVTFKLDDK